MNIEVKIKTWDEMEEEFGTDVRGDILVPYGFIMDMEFYMPENRVIEVMKGDKYHLWYINMRKRYKISKEMIAEEYDGEPIPGNT